MPLDLAVPGDVEPGPLEAEIESTDAAEQGTDIHFGPAACVMK